MAKREQAKKTDKYLTFPFSELTPDKKMKPELKEQVSRLEKQEEDFLAGTATLCLHCPFCTEELLLLDKRPYFSCSLVDCTTVCTVFLSTVLFVAGPYHPWRRSSGTRSK